MNQVKSTLIFVFAFITALQVFGQTIIKGKVTDLKTKTSIVGASIYILPNKGTVTDIDGNFSLEVEAGSYQVKCSFIGFKTIEKQVNVIQNQTIELALELEEKGLAEIRLFEGVGAEKFAEHAFNFADQLIREKTDNRCYVVQVECAEHGANSAIYEA